VEGVVPGNGRQSRMERFTASADQTLAVTETIGQASDLPETQFKHARVQSAQSVLVLSWAIRRFGRYRLECTL
jgi:hypothetical protein